MRARGDLLRLVQRASGDSDTAASNYRISIRCLDPRLLLRAEHAVSSIDGSFEVLDGCVVPGMGGFAPGIALFLDVIGEIGAAEADVGGEVDEGLGGAVEVEDALHAVAGPLDAGEAFAGGVFERADVVEEHGVEDGVLEGFVGAVAGVKVASGAFVFEDDGPGDGGGRGSEESAAGGEGEGAH